jgi:hypothetical protein
VIVAAFSMIASAVWRQAIEVDSPVDESSTTSSGRLVVEPLPFAYEQFGSLPGVA